MKGLPAEIYSGGFVDSYSPIKKAKNVTIVDEKVPRLFEASEEYPPVKLVRRTLFGKDYIHAEPIVEKPTNFASGGRFIYSCDSRFRELNQYPIPLHDRNMDLETRNT